MKSYDNLWREVCSYENLKLAYKRARRHKTTKGYVIEFEKDLEKNLLLIRSELLLHCYRPKALVTFAIYDPKARKISKSDFRDRIVHHAVCNIIEPIFDKTFISDSYANRAGKGTLGAVNRFDYFKRKASRNNTRKCYVLKADIKRYFENVDHKILINIIRKKIKDPDLLWLIRIIIANHVGIEKDKGMPLGNLTSQFFANVYLNELDHFVKNTLKARYYIRYVDDLIIMDDDKAKLEEWNSEINDFLKEKLSIELHPDKSRIICLARGVDFLGFRIFYYHKLLRKANMRKMQRKLENFRSLYLGKKMDYDEIYNSFHGWFAYAKHANTYALRRKIGEKLEQLFPDQISSMEINKGLKALGLNKISKRGMY